MSSRSSIPTPDNPVAGGALLLLVAVPAFSQVILENGFDAGMPSGWPGNNNSSPQGSLPWRGVKTSVQFPPLNGPYLANDLNAAAGVGTISDWLMTPVVSIVPGHKLRFHTRAKVNSSFPDRMEVRLSLSGSSTNVGNLATDVGDFGTLLVSINPTLVEGGYPEDWQLFRLTVPDVPELSTGRFAFRYFVTDGGPNGVNSDFIALDSVSVVGPDVFTDGLELGDSSAWSATVSGS